jgi:DNA-binding MarR family transcriptional regulator
MTHSAASQTVAQMASKGLVHVKPGHDLRRRVVHIGSTLEEMLPTLRRQWAMAAAAAQALDDELPSALGDLVKEAIQALERDPFSARMRTASRAKRLRLPNGEHHARVG